MKTLVKWSVEDYHQMIDAGILCDRQVELLAGEIIEMSPESPIHYYTTEEGTQYLQTLLASKVHVRFNGPITLSDSEPEPDIAIVRLPKSTYKDHHPYAEDIFWLIEVAKSSLKKDLELKLSIYAQARIEEYWVLDLYQKQLIVFRNPENNIYLSQQIINQGMINSLAFPDIEISVERLLS
ncbi:Uma2 family endonuclease [Planktothrix agardhii]|uniref:Uma2 family endonuclease n=1 Tax=Planktothrix agardhii TaxID=1160 RepID=UPI001F376A39|nr:Uma2 family endonuclease [Planktothrix agardhii]MCF3644659.1 Uma2 family endonuclease [Planktothrix agardhii 1026]MCF3647322.1 Uma2 family endonuclease [Planktothrix agardhii 1026]